MGLAWRVSRNSEKPPTLFLPESNGFRLVSCSELIDPCVGPSSDSPPPQCISLEEGEKTLCLVLPEHLADVRICDRKQGKKEEKLQMMELLNKKPLEIRKGE